jgi:hypothetical protein
VLSDPDKKSKYDKYGGDPEARFSGASASSGASPFSGFASQRAPRGGGGSMFEEEISPEELFRQFFGGGMGGGGFGGGPFGGFGMYQNGGRKLLTQQLTRAQQAAETVSSSTWVADPESDYTRWAATILEEGHTTIPTNHQPHPWPHYNLSCRYSYCSSSLFCLPSSPAPNQPTQVSASTTQHHRTHTTTFPKSSKWITTSTLRKSPTSRLAIGEI